MKRNHSEDDSWLGEEKGKMSDVEKPDKIKISIEDIQTETRKMLNWKAPGPDGVRGVWFKRFRSRRGVITGSLQGCLNSEQVSGCMIRGRTV